MRSPNHKPMADKEIVKKWQKVIDGSNGVSRFLPDSLTEDAENVERLRRDLNEEIARVAKKEIALNIATQNLFFEARRQFEGSGLDNIWVKDVGFNTDALEEGLFVVNITQGRR